MTQRSLSGEDPVLKEGIVKILSNNCERSKLPEAMPLGGAIKRLTKNLKIGNEMSTAVFKSSKNIPGNLEDHEYMQGCAHMHRM